VICNQPVLLAAAVQGQFALEVVTVRYPVNAVEEMFMLGADKVKAQPPPSPDQIVVMSLALAVAEPPPDTLT